MRGGASRRYVPLAVVALALLAIGFLPISIPTEDDTSTSGAPNGPPDYSAPAVSAGDTTTHAIGPIGSGTVVTQDFPAGGTSVASLSFFLGITQRIDQGTMTVTLQTQQNGQWAPIATQTIDEAHLKDKSFSTLSFAPPLAVARGQTIRIALAADPGADAAVTGYANLLWNTPDFPLFVNGDRQQGAAIIRVSYARATGRVFQMLGPLWDRATIFLDPLWRAILALGVVALGGGVAVAVCVYGERPSPERGGVGGGEPSEPPPASGGGRGWVRPARHQRD
jgi:hypothetical protein